MILYQEWLNKYISWVLSTYVVYTVRGRLYVLAVCECSCFISWQTNMRNTLKYFVGPPLALITVYICCALFSTQRNNNVTTFISIQNCIHFLQRSCFADERVKTLHKIFSSTSSTRILMG